VQVALLCGAGNIWRGKGGENMNPAEADSMGMLATIINCIAIRTTLDRLGQKAKLFTSVAMPSVADTFNAVNAVKYLEDGYIVIVGGGTGNPFFTTDTTVILRALELRADVALFAKRVAYLYNRDPESKDSSTKLFKYLKVNFSTVLEQGLKAIDLAATALCREKNMDVCLFKLGEVSFKDIVTGGKEPSTYISNTISDAEIVTSDGI
jgi:uridylate kinase